MPTHSNVGYKRPPASAQFKKGRSGNPKGRPNGRPNVANLTMSMLNEPALVRVGENTHTMASCEAIVRALVGKACQGDTKSLSAIMDILEMTGHTDDVTDEALEKRTMHLPGPFTLEQMDFLYAGAREKDRQHCQASLETDPARFATAEDEGTAQITVAVDIKTGDELAAAGEYEPAFRAYQSELARCKTALLAVDSDKQAQADFRRAVGRIGLLADQLLLAGQFEESVKIADAAIAEGQSPFWIAPEDAMGRKSANTIWISAIRAHASMLLGHVDQARMFYCSFQTNKRHVETSWESAIIRDFGRLRRAGHFNPLMDVIAKRFADEGWTLEPGNKMFKRPVMSGEDSVFIQMNPDDIKSGDLLDQYDQPDKAAYTYIRNFNRCKAKLELAGATPAAEANLQIAASRIERMARKFVDAGRFALALDCSDAALTATPDKLQLHAMRAQALMFLGRDDDALDLFLRYRGHRIGDKSWEDEVRCVFAEQRKAGRSRELMDVVEKNLSGNPESLQPDPAISSAQTRETRWLATFLGSSDISAGETLEARGMLNEALTVYGRCLTVCADKISKIATGQVNIRAIEERNAAIAKIVDLAAAFLAEEDFGKALDATDLALSALPNSPLPNIYRGHALMFLDRADEAREIYLRYRRARLSNNEFAEKRILQDFVSMRGSGLVRPLMTEIEAVFAAPKEDQPVGLAVPCISGELVGFQR